MFGLNFVSTDIEYRKEVYLYPLNSFICELGGGLGLFLGVSCMALMDWITLLMERRFFLFTQKGLNIK